MLKLAVVGKDVSKSESGKMHAFILRGMGSDCEYEHISVAAEKFDALAEKLLAEKDAFNVTIPYKLSVIPHLNSLEGDAKIFGAVNTVKDRIGYNTDGAGFMLMLQNNGIETSGRRFLVLGAGGAGRSVVKKLADAGAHVFLYDMNVQNAEIVATEFGNIRPLASLQPAQYDVIVNATAWACTRARAFRPSARNFSRAAILPATSSTARKRASFCALRKGSAKRS